MNIADLLSAERVLCDSQAANKRQVLQLLGGLLAGDQSAVTTEQAFDSLNGRELLSSTGLGRGVALPHGRLDCGPNIIGAFIKLQHGVEFQAIDRRPVDLVFGLLVPERCTTEHLTVLAYLAEMFSDSLFCHQLRRAASPPALFDRLIQWKPAP